MTKDNGHVWLFWRLLRSSLLKTNMDINAALHCDTYLIIQVWKQDCPLSLIFFFFLEGSLCSPGCSGVFYVDQDVDQQRTSCLYFPSFPSAWTSLPVGPIRLFPCVLGFSELTYYFFPHPTSTLLNPLDPSTHFSSISHCGPLDL